MTEKYADLALSVAERALDYDYKLWGFGEGLALLGVLQTGALLDRPDLIDGVTDLVLPILDEPPVPEDHLIPVEVLRLLRRLRAVETSKAERRWLSAVRNAYRPVPDRPPVHRPDLPGLASLIWVDCMHTDGPGLARLENPRLAVDTLEENAAVLQDSDSGLFSHGYDVATGRSNGVHWGRGQGWALHGMIGTLLEGPHNPRWPYAESLHQRTARLLDALAKHDLDGGWRTIVDDETAPVENSVSALVASAILAGVKAGVLDDGWLPMAERALTFAVAAVDGDAGLPVSTATPVGEPEEYKHRELGVFPWGQGPLLLALRQSYEWKLW
jgi:unsaturated rhamnogalacturonyl hydrolase